MISDDTLRLRKSYIEAKRIIRKAMKDDQLVLFVGAGASIGAGMPTWTSAVKEIARHLGIDSENEPLDNLRIPQYYYNARGKKEYTQLMREIFCHELRLQKQPVHDKIIEFNTRTIITTNYDHLIEMATEDNSEVIQVVSKDSDLPYRKIGKELIKMHGDFENDNFVLKEDDYLAYSTNFKLIENYVKSIIGTKVVLFLGYSFNDPDVKQIFTWVKSILGDDFQRAYLLESSRPYDINEAEYYKNFGINVLYASLQLGDMFNEKDISNNLLEMLNWLLKEDEPAMLDKINYGLLPFADVNYASEKYLSRVFREAGLEVSNGVLSEIPYMLPSTTNAESIKILRAIVYERCVDLLSNHDLDLNDKEKFENILKLVDKCKAEPNELDKIRYVLTVLKKSGIHTITFFEPSVTSELDVPIGEYNIPEWFNAMKVFNYEELKTIADKNNAHLSETRPDLYFEQGYINYALGEYLLSYNCFKNAASIYYRKRKFVKFFLSEVNRFFTGKIISNNMFLALTLDKNDVNIVKTEIEALDLERIFNSLPDLGGNNEVFKDIYTRNITYTLFHEAYLVSEKVREQANTRYFIFGGEAAFSALRNRMSDYYKFITLNCLAVDRYSESINIFKIYFQSILGSVMTFDLDEPEENKDIDIKNIHADNLCEFDIMIALRYETDEDLKKMLQNTNIILPLGDDALDYFINVIKCCKKNTLKNFSLTANIFWKVILLLGHCKLNQTLTNIVLQKLDELIDVIDYTLQTNFIIKFFMNADRQCFITNTNVIEIEKFLNYELNCIIKNKSNSFTEINLVILSLSLCKKYERVFDNDAIISELISQQTRELCIKMYPYLGCASQKVICDKYKDWEFQDNVSDINFSRIINHNSDTENKIYSYCSIDDSENGINYKGNHEQLIYNLLNLYLNGFIIYEDRCREIIKNNEIEIASWLINLNDYDYDKFNINWLSSCSENLLSKISGQVKVKIACKLVEAYKTGKLNKKLIDIYFNYFA